MAETTRPAPEPGRSTASPEPAPSVPRRQSGEPQIERQTVTVAGTELEVTPPTPTQEEADAIKDRAMTGGTEPPPEPPAGETQAQRRERETREQQQRDQRPGAQASGYQTR